LFSELAARYADRPGGYTRIQKFGYREGDHAPRAILQLVDGPRDTRFHLAAREAGRQLASKLDRHSEIADWRRASTSSFNSVLPLLHPFTQYEVQKTLKYKSEAEDQFNKATQDAFDEVRAKERIGNYTPDPQKRQKLVRAGYVKPVDWTGAPMVGHKPKAGEPVSMTSDFGRKGFVQRRVAVKAGTAMSRAKGVQASTKWQRLRNRELPVRGGVQVARP
jgi:hypothetical protein